MLHLFNSCYVAPDVLFDPSVNHFILGDNNPTLSTNSVQGSFYYQNSNVKSSWGTYQSVEHFINGNMFEPTINNTEKVIGYADKYQLLRMFDIVVKTKCPNLDEEWYWKLRKMFAVRMKRISSLLTNETLKQNLTPFIDYFLDESVGMGGYKLRIDPEWVRQNAGVEWKIAKGDYSSLPDFIDRYVYSYYEEAKTNYLSRNPHAKSWAIDPVYSNIKTVPSMAEFYKLVRKEVYMILDTELTSYYETGDVESLVSNNKFLLLFSNKNLLQKVDIWLLRLLLIDDYETKKLGILA